MSKQIIMRKIYLLNLLLLLAFSYQATARTNENAFVRQMEYLDRGLVGVKLMQGVFLSWRIFVNDDKNTAFNIYRDGVLVNSTPLLRKSNYNDSGGSVNNTYQVKAVVNGEEIDESNICTPWRQQYLRVQLNRPQDGVTPPNVVSTGTSTVHYPEGQPYSYTPNDMSVADLDGDGEYELIVKWDPDNSKDNAHTGITGNVYLDAYKLDGTQLWRIDLGHNIRAGAHYTQFMVYDLDGDGIAELVCKTAPGTVDGEGNYVLKGSDKATDDYRNLAITASGNKRTGYIQNGPEYLTLFDGKTGKELHTIDYKPNRSGSWGDSYGNRVDRYLACIAYLDGQRPSVVMCRGYYTRATLAAYDVVNKKLVERWFYDSGTSASKNNAYGQGNHGIAVGDVDNDGYDEIIYGGAAIDHNGKLLYNTQTGHGDAGHLSDLDPTRPGLEWFQPHEDKAAAYGHEFRDAGTGEVLWGFRTGSDNGRGMTADIDPTKKGFENWSSAVSGLYSCKGTKISDKKPNSTNFRVYWDGDLQDELLDGNKISKWNPQTQSTSTLFTMTGCSSNNSTKSTPCLSADILGDWREEVILRETDDPSAIRIYTTTIPSNYGLYTLMHDPVYRLSIAWQNVAYNQPPHLGFYIGEGLETIPYPEISQPRINSGGSGIEQIEIDCRAYVRGNELQLEATENLKLVSCYGINGVLLSSESELNSCSHTVNMNFSDKIFIVRIVTESGSKAIKVVR